MCCVRTGMSFSEEAAGPQPHFRIMSWTLVLITLGVKVLSSHLPASDAPIQLRRQRSPDQAHGTAAQAERRRRGACFLSMINAVRSSADAAQDFKDQRASFSRAASTRRKASTSLQPAGFCFAISLDSTQVHRKPSRTSGLLLHEQPHRKEVGCADGLKKRYMCFSRPLCETCVADSLCPANMRYLLRSDRGLVLRVTCVQSRLYVLYYRCGGEHLSSYVRTCDCLSYIYIQSASIHTMVPVHT